MTLRVEVTMADGSSQVLEHVEPGQWAAESWLTSLGQRERLGVAEVLIHGTKLA